MQVYKQIWQYWKKYKFSFYLYVGFGFIIYVLLLIVPTLSGQIINEGVGQLNSDVLLVSVGLLLLCLLARHILSYIRSIVIVKYSQYVINDLRNDIFNRLLYQSAEYLHSQQSGEIMTIYSGDAEVCKNFYYAVVPAIIEQAFGLVGASIMLFVINPWMALSIFAFLPLMYFTARLYGKKMRPLNIATRDGSAALNSVVQENLSGMRIVRSFHREQYEIDKMDKYNGAYRDILVQHINTNAKYSIYNHTSIILPQIACVIIGSILLLFGANGSASGINIGEYYAFWGYAGYVTGPILNFAISYINMIQQTNASGTKLFNFINTGSTITDAPDAEEIANPHSHFKMEHVSLKMDGKVVLDDINLDIPKGKRIAITGTTGSGKSMLINMLSRVYDPTEGKITLDGKDIRKVPLRQLRRQTSTVAQEAFLFSDTIENNIAFFEPDAPDELIHECARIAQADGFVSRMPEGYRTVVGERGTGLSGGQRQRLSIARALLKRSPVLILDDSTSALDMDTERTLLSELDKNLHGNTLIIIAHRISALKSADEILFMKDGRIIERGTHDELMAMNGEYAQTARDQYGAMYGT